MKHLGIPFVLVLILVFVSFAWSQLLEGYLLQNVPEPFCSSAGGTQIEYGLSKMCDVRLEVWNESMTEVVRTLIDESKPAGAHMVVWDGRDNLGVFVPDGSYPYVLETRDEYGVVEFSDTLVAHVACATEVQKCTWGSLKKSYDR
jgi:hypothetical protein